jgi:hypothetical protein
MEIAIRRTTSLSEEVKWTEKRAALAIAYGELNWKQNSAGK